MTQINISIKQKQTHRYREKNCGCQGGRWRREGLGFGISRCKLIYIGWINNKVLLYSTGNYIPYPVINHKGNHIEALDLELEDMDSTLPTPMSYESWANKSLWAIVHEFINLGPQLLNKVVGKFKWNVCVNSLCSIKSTI